MDSFRNPMYAAEPYQESQGGDSSPASPDDLAAFYRDMEQKEIVERRLSRKSNSGISIWSRKSLKRSATAPPVPPPLQKPPSKRPLNTETRREVEREASRDQEDIEKSDWVPAMNSPRSIIPDTMKDLPTSYKDTWASAPLPSHRIRYNIHNPVGPRWYKNHHLIPLSQVRPGARPPTFFSPSFPPITSSAHERSEDATRAGPSRTPSNSPLPTPDSSQTRVDGPKPRSRKTSETAHDNVDLLDVTDPWGTNWHHHSPYDIGLGNEPVSIDVQDALHTRSRRSSLTAQSRRKTITPSPLSQSTSAIHLQVPDSSTIQLPRKLSKRRPPAAGSIFGGAPPEPPRNAVSLPATPIEHAPHPAEGFQQSDLPKRMSVAPIIAPPATQSPTPKKEKRGSVLGRLVKKFSLLRKPTAEKTVPSTSSWQRVSAEREDKPRAPPLEKAQSDVLKRIPPPSIDHTSPLEPDRSPREADRSSSISLEAPYSMGRLTITNPDVPGSGDTTPAGNEMPLPSLNSGLEDNRSTLLAYVAYDEALNRSPVTPTQSHGTYVQTTHDPHPSWIPGGEYTPLPSTSNGAGTLSPTSTWNGTPALEPHSPTSTNIIKSPTSPVAGSSKTINGAPAERRTDRSMSYSRRATVSSPNYTPSVERIPSPSNRPWATSESKPTIPSPSVPFPSKEADEQRLSVGGAYSYEDSPLSAASMLANPPTPYSTDKSMPGTPEAPPPPLPSKQERKPTLREKSPSVHSTSRQTETFKLVRSLSGNVYASTETIVAGGQQWEVVESIDNKGKGRSSKPRDQEAGGSRREKKRDDRIKGDADAEPETRRRQSRDHIISGERSTKPAPSTSRTTNPDHHRGSSSAETRQDTIRSSRKRDEDRKPDRTSVKPTSLNINKPQPPPPPPTPGAPSQPLRRNPSITARPTSELASAAEMNALRAKEAWDMERLWKARSMYGDDANAHTISSTSAVASSNGDAQPQDNGHGSSHTAFVVQSPFQSLPSHIYHSMPAGPPPIIYNSPSLGPASPHNFLASPNHSDSVFSPSNRKSFTSTLRPALTNNPLPEPPRESTYESSPLPPSIFELGPTDYWTTQTGVATLH